MSFHEPIPPAQNPSPVPEPPSTPPSHSWLRHPMVAALLVVVLAAFGGAALAHVLWPTSTTTSSSPLFGGNVPSGGGSGSSFGGLFPSQGSGDGSGSVSGAAPSAADAAVASKIDPALVDIDTVISGGAAAGTGMVVTPGGEVLTNNHVINGATQITAYDIGNGKTYTARVVGYDRTQDVAVIKLENASGLKTVPLGDSADLHVGAGVVTIGNAGGVGGTPSVASGSVDALNRSITAGDEDEAGDVEQLRGVIQINGSLEPGDSGGPLVSRGKVVGMDTAASTDFSFQSQTAGEGFAIPINEARTIAERIVAGQSSNLVHIGATALIGVYISNTSQCENTETGITGGGSGVAGALVCGVVAGTPAAATGLSSSGINPANEYDTITGLDGKAVNSAKALLSAMDTHHPGDRVAVRWVDPSGASHTATLTLTTGPAD